MDNLSEQYELLKTQQRSVIESLNELLENEAISKSFAANIRDRAYKACENAHKIGRIESRIDYNRENK